MKIKNERVYETRDIASFRDLIEGSVAEHAERPAFVLPDGDGVKEISYAEFFSEIKALTAYLHSLKLENKHIAVIGKNSYEWLLSYFAVSAGTGVVVPLDKELKPIEIANLVEAGDVSAIIYSDDVTDRVEPLPEGVKRIKMSEFPTLLEKGRTLISKGNLAYENHKVDHKAMGVILFTSGTTGLAKGVMLSQYNICTDIMLVLRRVRVYSNDRVMSVLPLHHTYENTVDIAMLYAGASISFCGGLRTLLSDFTRYRPTLFACVPLIMENFYANIMKKYASIKGGSTIYGLQSGLSRVISANNHAFGKTLFSKIHEVFGGRMRVFLCGAASLPADMFRAYERMGFKVYIGYGLTETSPVASMHNDSYQCPDDIGFPFIKNKIIDSDETGVGELAVKGPNVMLGYYKNSEATAEVFTEDGYFRTGDLVIRKPNGAYKIVGRVKSMIVTKNGKKIFPDELEYYLLKSPYISECLVYGNAPISEEDDVVVMAAVFPNYEAVDKKFTADKKTTDRDSHEYHADLKALIAEAVKDANRNLPHFRMIQKTVIRNEEFIKTSTKKIKRGEKSNYGE